MSTRDRLDGLIDAARREASPERAIALFDEALILLGERPEPVRADVLRWMGTLYRERGDSVQAELHYTTSLRLAEECRAVGSQAQALNCLALMAQRRAQTEVASGFYRRAARLALLAQDHRLRGMIEQNLGVLASIRGDLDGALVNYADSLSAFEAAEDDEGISWVLNNLGIVHTNLGDHEEADAALRRGLELSRQRGDLHMESLFLVNQAALDIKRGTPEKAPAALERALAIADLREDKVRRAEVLKLKGVLEREAGRAADGVVMLEAAHDLAVETGDTLLHAEVMRELGDTWSALGDHDRAVGLWEQAGGYFRELGAVVEAVEIESRLSAA